MRVASRVPWFALWALTLLVGCAVPPIFGPSGNQQAQVQRTQQQQYVAAQQQQSLQAAASSLDRVNEEKERQLAASRQDVQRLEAHVAALSSRLKDTAAELVQERSEKQALDKKYEDMLAANHRTGTVTITANSSHGVDLSAVEIRGVDVRRDNDVIRVTLPARDLFVPGSSQLVPGAGNLLDTVSTELARNYPRQLIGIEGHTDSGSSAATGGQDPLQFSTSRALAVYTYLVGRGRLRPEQLHVTGHGGNHPAYSNATPGGREANQRIELVVYPETLNSATQ